MRLDHLDLFDFRNFPSVSLDLGDGLFYLYGPNGAGKTNLLEAIAYLAFARSFRKSQDKDLIRLGQAKATIQGRFSYESETYTKTVEAIVQPMGKALKTDGKKVNALSSFVGTVLVTVFDPKKVFLFKGEPSERRKAMDECLSLIDPKYLYSLSRYKKLLKERNQALIQRQDEEVLDVLARELIAQAYNLSQARLKLVEYVNVHASTRFRALFGGEATLSFKYRTNVPVEPDYAKFQEAMLGLFDEKKSIEAIRKATAIGPHLDDLTASLNGTPLASFGSQGQNRLAALSFFLALADMIADAKKEKPILILDDVLSDLDADKKANLIQAVTPMGQVFVSGSREDSPKGCRPIRVEDGKVAMIGE